MLVGSPRLRVPNGIALGPVPPRGREGGVNASRESARRLSLSRARAASSRRLSGAGGRRAASRVSGVRESRRLTSSGRSRPLSCGSGNISRERHNLRSSSSRFDTIDCAIAATISGSKSSKRRKVRSAWPRSPAGAARTGPSRLDYRSSHAGARIVNAIAPSERRAPAVRESSARPPVRSRGRGPGGARVPHGSPRHPASTASVPTVHHVVRGIPLAARPATLLDARGHSPQACRAPRFERLRQATYP